MSASKNKATFPHGLLCTGSVGSIKTPLIYFDKHAVIAITLLRCSYSVCSSSHEASIDRTGWCCLLQDCSCGLFFGFLPEIRVRGVTHGFLTTRFDATAQTRSRLPAVAMETLSHLDMLIKHKQLMLLISKHSLLWL